MPTGHMLRRWIMWGLVVAFLWLVVSKFSEVRSLAKTLTQGQIQWILAAVLVQAVYFIVFAASYKAAFHTVEIKGRLRDLVPVVFGSLFVNVVAPSAGTAGAALFIDDGKRRGVSPGRTAAGTLLQLVADYSAFVLVLLPGLAYLFTRHDLMAYEVGGAVILFAITIGLSSVLLLGLWRPNLLFRLLSWIQRTANLMVVRLRSLGPGKNLTILLEENWAQRNAVEFSQASNAIAAHPDRLLITLGVALSTHMIEMLSIYILFMAFGQQISVGAILAGYAIGILFLIISITPQGIGVVEGVMILVFTTLGVPGAIATVVVLAFRGLSFWFPLLIGFILLRRLQSFKTTRRGSVELWNLHIVAILTAAMGLFNLLSAVTPSLPGRLMVLKNWAPLFVRHGGHLTAALSGFFLLLLAGGLWRRKRNAWLLTMVVLVVSIASNIIKGLDYAEALLSAGLAIWLWFLRPYFRARSDPPSIKQGLRTLVLALFFTLLYGVAGFYLLDRHFQVNFGLWAALRQTVVMFTQFYNPGLQPVTGFGRYFADSIYFVGAATLSYALLMLVRPVLIRQPATAGERERARQIIEAHGRTSLAHIALLNNKSYYFSPGGSLIAYTVRGRVALALGDPVGPNEDASPAIAGFRDFCVENDWLVAFVQTLPDYLKLYKQHGFEALCIGNEAIVDLAAFSLEGRSNKNVRTGVNRLNKLGYRTELLSPPLSQEKLKELRSVSDEWLDSLHGKEKHFALGWFGDEYIRNSLVMVVCSPAGELTAFTTLAPEYQRNEITVDLMRHRQDAIGGTMDFLFASLFEWARVQGYDTFNLGMSSLAKIGEHSEDPAIERALHFIYEYVNQFYNFKGLYAYKDKFHPQWSPRYLVYPQAAKLPAIGLALMRVN